MIPLSRDSSTTRRRFLGGSLALGAAAAGLSACRVQTQSNEAPLGETLSPDDLPEPAARLPEGDVTIRWMSGGPGAKSAVFKALFPAYQRKHPNITVTYNELTNDKIGEVLPIQLRNGNADDVFQTVGIPISQLVSSGKVAALDDVIPDFENWKAAMPDGVIVPGVDEFDGKTYQFRVSTDRRLQQMVLFNTEIMERAGYDPVAEPFDLDTFRAAAKKITEQGDEKYYGLQTSVGNPTDLVTFNGGPPNFDYRTGTYQFADDRYVEVMELLKAMAADGSLFPGFASLNDQQARGQFPLGRAGMIINGPWNFPVWKGEFPDFDFGVAPLPMTKDQAFRYAAPVGGNGYAVYVDAPDDHKLVGGDLLHFFGTELGQKVWARYDGAADPAWSTTAIAELRDSGQLSEHDVLAFEMYDEYVRMLPAPVVANPDQEKVQLAMKPIKPNLNEILKGYLTGQIADVRQALQKLTDASEKGLDDAIAQARSQGAEVSRDDWVFANWDPTKDYTTDDYANR